ncbi:MAG: HAMP domain-containing histidine kinase, partial [Methanosarcinales archaeon]|nr:HAMP domain-containing histidine kinase [Methanosarcinales archaeon]
IITSVIKKDGNGNVIGYHETIRDITERKRMEEERERIFKDLEVKNSEMERFVYTVSHDLRSPLVTIQGYTELLRKDIGRNETEQVETDLKYIANAATTMDLLLKDTLQLSRVGRVTNPPEDVPFGEIVKEALELIAEHIKSSGVDVSMAKDFPTVHVDRMRIREVLVNLIENSINYRDEQPSPKINMGYRVDGGEIVFFVQDNGIGMDKSQHKKVFDLFYKVDKSSSKGTGAGLAIVKRIIEVQGGRIWIESEKGKGCTICFTLPIV